MCVFILVSFLVSLIPSNYCICMQLVIVLIGRAESVSGYSLAIM